MPQTVAIVPPRSSGEHHGLDAPSRHARLVHQHRLSFLGGATTPVEGDDPPKRKEKGAEAKQASALAFFSTVGPPELLKDIG